MKPLAIFAGSFDPPTLGHLSIVRRCARLFREVVVLIAVNPDKESWFTPQERVEMWKEITADLENLRVETTEDLVAVFAASQSKEVLPVLVRGVRCGADLDYELLLAGANRELGGGLETLFLPPGPAFKEVSSTEVRTRLRAGHSVDTLLHPWTARRILNESGER